MTYPIVLDLRGVPVLLVGAGPVGARKLAGLLEAGAAVTVVAPAAVREVQAAAAEGRCRWIARPYRSGDVGGARLVLTATGLAEVDSTVAADARAAGVWVNSADDPERCDFTLPAVLRRGDVVVAVSTGGASPALAGYVRDRVAEVIGPEYGPAAADLRAQRAAVHAGGGSTEALDWRRRVADAVERARRGRP